jgi:hypothetical protein
MWTLDSSIVTLDASIDLLTLDGVRVNVIRPIVVRDIVLGSRVPKTVYVQKRLSKDVKVGGVTNVL